MTLLDSLFQSFINRLVLLAEGPAVAWSAKVKGGERSNEPVSYGSDVHRLIRDYKRATSDHARLRVCFEAAQAYNELVYRRNVELHRGTREWKVAIATDRRSKIVVSRVYGVPMDKIEPIREEVRGRIRSALDAGDVSLRDVAREFGVGKDYVRSVRAVV